MKIGYEATENDLFKLANAIKGKTSKTDLKEILKNGGTDSLEELQLNRITITFDKNNKVASIKKAW